MNSFILGRVQRVSCDALFGVPRPARSMMADELLVETECFREFGFKIALWEHKQHALFVNITVVCFQLGLLLIQSYRVLPN